LEVWYRVAVVGFFVGVGVGVGVVVDVGAEDQVRNFVQVGLWLVGFIVV
jgi:hypothetical protein